MRVTPETLRSVKTSVLIGFRASCLRAVADVSDSEIRRAGEIALPLVVAELKMRGVN